MPAPASSGAVSTPPTGECCTADEQSERDSRKARDLDTGARHAATSHRLLGRRFRPLDRLSAVLTGVALPVVARVSGLALVIGTVVVGALVILTTRPLLIARILRARLLLSLIHI